MVKRFQVFIGDQYATEAFAGTAVLAAPSYERVDWLDPTYMSVVCNGEIGEVRCRAAKHPEDVLNAIDLHSPIWIKDFGAATGSSESSEEETGTIIFSGVIVKIHTTLNGTEENTEIVAYNNGDYLLDRIVLHGQTRWNHSDEENYYDEGLDSNTGFPLDPSDLITIDQPLVFNPDGLPNAHAQEVYINDPDYGGDEQIFHLFDAPGRNQTNDDGDVITAVPWKLSWAVAYLLMIYYNATWALDRTSYFSSAFHIFTTNGDPVISNINLEGKSLLEGLKLLLEPHNYIFWIDPALSTESTNHQQHVLHFAYRGDTTNGTTVRLSPRGSDAGNATYNSNLISTDLVIDSTSVVNTIRSFGAPIEFTTMCHTNSSATGVLKLVKAWEDDDLTFATNTDGTCNPFDTTFRKNYCHPDLVSTDIDGTPYAVGRMWVVNSGEAPASTLENWGTKLLQGTMPHNSTDPRRLERPDLFVTNSAGGLYHQEDIQVEMSFDSGTNWDIVEREWYRVLPESAGIVFVTPKLERLGLHFKNNTPGGSNYWEALHSNKLQIRILCSVRSDERLKSLQTNIGDSVPLATERVYSNEGYRKFVFNSAINSSVYWTNYQPYKPTQDDSTLLDDITGQQGDRSDRLMTTGNMAVLLGTVGEYHPGHVITAITNRYDFDPAPTVLRTIYDFQNLHVQLVLDSRLVKSLVNARRIEDSDRREAKLGVQGMQQFEGGNHVPFLPGIQESYRQSLRDGQGG